MGDVPRTRVLAAALCLLLVALGAPGADEAALEVLAPQPGQHFRQLETIRISVRAARGVATRTISLSVDGAVIKRLPTPAPWREFTLDWPVGERKPGVYTLHVSTVAADGVRLQSAPLQVVVDEAPWFPAPRERSYALLIGVGQYQDKSIAALSFSTGDVKAIYRVLTDPAIGAYPPANVMMLTDDCPPERQPTRSVILGALKNWLGQVGKDADSVLLFFSGHGIEEGGKGYLVPRDAEAGILSDTGVDLERVNQLLQETGAKAKILLVDACHSAAGKSVKVQMAQGLAGQLFSGGEGRVTLASCKEDQRSWEWPEKGQSVFTYYLAEALAGAADADRDRRVTLEEVNRYVHGRVMAWAAENRREQEPRLKADFSGELVLTGLTPGKAPIRIPGASAVAVAPAPSAPVAAAPAPAAAADEPAAGATWTNPKDGMQFVYVPAGPFTMGDAENDSEKPAHPVSLPGFWIGKCEVTVGQFRQFARAASYQARDEWQKSGDDDRLPVGYITWEDAVAYCRWAGVRLPSEAEWEKAARGTDARQYPWGNEWDKDRCQSADERHGFALFAPVGSFPGGASPYGCLDMAGNVWEWTSTLFRPYPYRADDGREHPAGDPHVLRGGGSYDGWRGYMRAAYRAPGGLNAVNRGFRCAVTDPPAGVAGVSASPPSDNPAGIEFVRIPAGEGVAEFEMGKYEVTVAQFRNFIEATGYKTAAERLGEDRNWRNGWGGGSEPVRENQPVVRLSQEDARAYCKWAGGRLPTNAEWEHAARGGTVGKEFGWGESWPPPKGVGNLADATYHRRFPQWGMIDGYDDGYAELAPVGSFPPNRYGLYDMVGNAWEWVEDGNGTCRGCDFHRWERDHVAVAWQNWYGNPVPDTVGFRVARSLPAGHASGAAPAVAHPDPPVVTGAGRTWTDPKHGMEFVFVPAGPFVMGEAQEQHTVTLPGFWIGKCEVTVGQYRRYCEATGQAPPPDQAEDAHPVVSVTWAEAAAYALWAGCRLPSEAEWEKAARGTDGRMYPWGNTWDPARCNTNEGGPGRTAPVGSYPNGASPSGCLDMAGNVWEWTSTKHKPFPYRADDGREEPGGGDERVPRGGGWNFGSPGARTCNRYGLAPELRINALGFRLAKSSQ